MPILQDPFRHRLCESYEPELQLKQNTSKQLFLDPDEIREIKPSYDREDLTSGNESDDGNQGDSMLHNKHQPMGISPKPCSEVNNPKQLLADSKTLPRYVRFESPDNEIESFEEISQENEFSDDECDYVEKELCTQHNVNEKPRPPCHKIPIRDFDVERKRTEFPEDNKCYCLSHKKINSCEVRDHDEILKQIYEEFYAKHKTKTKVKDRLHESKHSCMHRPKSSPESYMNERTIRRATIPDDYEEMASRTHRQSLECPRSSKMNLMEPEKNCMQRFNKSHQVAYVKSNRKSPSYRLEQNEENSNLAQPCDCYDCCMESRSRVLSLKTVQLPHQGNETRKPHKHSFSMVKDFREIESPTVNNLAWKETFGKHRKVHQECIFRENQVYSALIQRPRLEKTSCYQEEVGNRIVAKKKMLEENYEGMPMGDEQQESHFSDSTYKVSIPTYMSTHPSNGGILTNTYLSKIIEKKNEMAGDSVPELIYYPEKSGSREKIHKMRSRRTKMNRLKGSWKKAFVHTVRGGTKNERVGLIVMGPNGPEFYSKVCKKSSGTIPFRKTRSFPEGQTKRNILGPSSEPGAIIEADSSQLKSPKDDTILEDRIAAFSKNVDDIVKNTEERFFKNLTKEELKDLPPSKSSIKDNTEGKVETENRKDEDKDSKEVEELSKMEYPPFRSLPFEVLSPKMPKSLKSAEKQEKESAKLQQESKTIAQCFNDRSKQFETSQTLDETESRPDEIKELENEYPIRKKSAEAIEANLRFWGMNSENEEENETKTENRKNAEEKSKPMKDEESQAGSVKSNEQININKQRRKKYYESTMLGLKYSNKYYDRSEDRSCDGYGFVSLKENSDGGSGKFRSLERKSKWEESPSLTKKPEEKKIRTDKERRQRDSERKMLSEVFQDLVGDGCAISEKESENLQNLFNKMRYDPELQSDDVSSSSFSEDAGRIHNDKPKNFPGGSKSPSSYDRKVILRGDEKSAAESKFDLEKLNKPEEEKRCSRSRFYKDGKIRSSRLDSGNEEPKTKKSGIQRLDSQHSEIVNKKISRPKDSKESISESKMRRKSLRKCRDVKGKRKLTLEEKMKIVREALPSITAENEALHFKQLKKCIRRFIDRVELKSTSSSETKTKKETRNNIKESSSTDGSEVKVDARKIIDIVGNPFKKIASDMTINIAKTLTDALVQENSSKSTKTSAKLHKDSDEEKDENSVSCGTSLIGSDRTENAEPTYLKQLKKMRNDHLTNIVLEVRRLNELLRYSTRMEALDRSKRKLVPVKKQSVNENDLRLL